MSWNMYNDNHISNSINNTLNINRIINKKNMLIKKDIRAVKQPIKAPTRRDKLKIPIKSPIAARKAVISKPPS